MPTATPANSPLGGTGPRHLSLTTSDPEAGIEVLERVYAIRQIEIDRTTPFRMAQVVHGVEGLHLEQARLQGAPTGALVDATGIVRIGQVYDGGLALTDHTHTRPGRAPFLFPVRPYACRWDDLGLLSLSLDFTAVQDHARSLLGREEFELRFHVGAPVGAPMAQYLARLITALGRDQLDSDAMSHPLIRQEAFRSAATAVLHTFPSTFLDQPSQPADAERLPGGVCRAVAHMEEHLSDPLTLADLAAAASMSPRGLQAAFARHLETTPMGHLRSLRLAAAHAELVEADPAAGDTVAAVAARWGFPHPGRFAADYRAAYGGAPQNHPGALNTPSARAATAADSSSAFGADPFQSDGASLVCCIRTGRSHPYRANRARATAVTPPSGRTPGCGLTVRPRDVGRCQGAKPPRGTCRGTSRRRPSR